MPALLLEEHRPRFRTTGRPAGTELTKSQMSTVPLRTLLALLLLPVLPADLAGQQADPPESVLEGAYTRQQAERGMETFRNECSFCHVPAEFRGRIFQVTWTGRTVGDLFGELRTTMPLDNPGSLSAEEYAAVIAYILALNGYPEGEADLPPDRDALGEIRIEPPPDPGR